MLTRSRAALRAQQSYPTRAVEHAGAIVLDHDVRTANSAASTSRPRCAISSASERLLRLYSVKWAGVPPVALAAAGGCTRSDSDPSGSATRFDHVGALIASSIAA